MSDGFSGERAAVFGFGGGSRSSAGVRRRRRSWSACSLQVGVIWHYRWGSALIMRPAVVRALQIWLFHGLDLLKTPCGTNAHKPREVWPSFLKRVPSKAPRRVCWSLSGPAPSSALTLPWPPQVADDAVTRVESLMPVR